MKKIISFVLAASMVIAPFAGVSVSAAQSDPVPRIYYSFDQENYQAVENQAAGDYTAKGFGSIESSDHAVKGNSLYLKGGYLKLPDNCLADTDSLSISFWAESKAATKNVHIFDIGNDPSTFLNISAYRGTNEYAADLRINGDAEEITAGDKNTFKKSVWTYITVNCTGKSMSVYKDGVKIHSLENMKHSIAELGVVKNALLGYSLWSADPSFYGYVDEFKIFDTALTDEQIKNEYQNGLSAMTANFPAVLPAYLAEINNLSKLDGVVDNLHLPVLSNFENTGFSIEWRTYDASVITADGKIMPADTAKTATVTAKIERDGVAASIFVPLTVAPKGAAVKADPIPTVTTAAGKLPVLPNMISANGGSAAVKVTWEIPDASVYTFSGTVYVNGKTEIGEKVVATVNVDASKFYNPIINQLAADPYVTYQDGYYYYVRSSDQGAGVMVAKSKRLQDIGSAPRVKVYSAPGSGSYSREYWAPEIHYLKDENGDYNWYVYVAADNGDNANHRMYVMRSTDPENAQAPYEMVGKIAPTVKKADGSYEYKADEDKWAIDGTVITTKQGYYFVWSGWPGNDNVVQNIYIAKMANPTTIEGSRTLISTPDTVWERKGFGNDYDTGAVTGTPQINEGPQQIISNDGKVYVTYSANGSWTDWYSLGYVAADENSDLLDASNWKKSDGPFFTQSLDPKDSSYSTGHASFVPSHDGKEQWVVYHAFQKQGGGWENRSARMMPVSWVNGMPYIGVPAADSEIIDQPSGTEPVVFGKCEAENGELENCNKSIDACASGKYYVTLNKTSKITFKVNVPETGRYQISFTGCHTTAGDGYQTLTVNGVPKRIRYMGSNVGASHYSTAFDPSVGTIGAPITDNLYKGENTIMLTYDSAAGGTTRVDYMSLTRIGDATPVPVSGVTLDKQRIVIVGAKTPLNVKVTPVYADCKTLRYSSSDSSVVAVDTNGVVTALKAGTAVITVTSSDDPNVKADCKFIVTDKTAGVVDGKVYQNGKLVVSSLVTVGGKKYYVNSNSVFAKNLVQKVGKITYAFDSKGRQVTGTKTVKIGKKYYYVKNGKVVTKSKWYKVKGKWVHVGKKKALDTHKILKHKGKTVYVNKKGYKLKKGKVKVGKRIYIVRAYVARRK